MTITREDRIKGVMLGQATADALGVHYETGIPSHGKAKMLGGGYGFAPGAWSDDTEQAICVLKGRSDPDKVARELLAWYEGGPADVGPTTGRTMSLARRQGGSSKQAGWLAEAMWAASKEANAGRAEGSLSNGSLMRTSPLALPYLGDPKTIVHVARQVSDLTHFDPMAGDATVLWSLLVNEAVENENFEGHAAVYRAIGMLPAERQHVWYELVKGPLMTGGTWRPPSSNLNVIKAFQAALWAVAQHHDYEQTVQAAIAIGGDTDTVAAIAGGLAGAIYGASTIPERWVKVLHGWPGLRAADITAMALDAASGS